MGLDMFGNGSPETMFDEGDLTGVDWNSTV